MEDFLTDFGTYLANPESYENPTEDLKVKSLAGLKKVFDYYQKFARESLQQLETKGGCKHVSTGPLTELYTEGLDEDQIWEQIQLVNEPVIKGLTPVVANLTSMLREGSFRLLINSDKTPIDKKKGKKGKKPPISKLGSHQVLSSGKEDSEEIDSDLEFSDEEEEEEEEVRKVVEASGRKSVVDDKFFKLSEMEKFLEMAEREDGGQGGGQDGGTWGGGEDRCVKIVAAPLSLCTLHPEEVVHASSVIAVQIHWLSRLGSNTMGTQWTSGTWWLSRFGSRGLVVGDILDQ